MTIVMFSMCDAQSLSAQRKTFRAAAAFSEYKVQQQFAISLLEAKLMFVCSWL